MAAVSSSLMSRSALAARARVYAAEAMRRACSGGIDSSLATIRRTVAVSPARVRDGRGGALDDGRLGRIGLGLEETVEHRGSSTSVQMRGGRVRRRRMCRGTWR